MLRLKLFPDATGEPRLFSHGRKNYEKGNYQWWLHWPGNCLALEWAWGRRRLGAMITLSDEGETHLIVSFSLPYILTFYLLLDRCNWLIRLMGLKWQRESRVGECRREIGFRVMDNALWIYPWIDSDTSMDYWVIRPLNFLLGQQRYSREGLKEEDALVTLPEGTYPARVQLYTAVWKRPRWPWAKRISRAEVEVAGGIPIPGKGDNSWDMEDDAIEEMTMPAGMGYGQQVNWLYGEYRERVK